MASLSSRTGKSSARPARLCFLARSKRAPGLSHVRDGELFDHKWIYFCDANKVSHFSEVNAPESNVVQLGEERSYRPD